MAFREPLLIGDEQALFLEFDLDRRVIVGESDELWNETIAALDADPRCRMKAPEWRVRLVAVPNDQDAVIEVLS